MAPGMLALALAGLAHALPTPEKPGVLLSPGGGDKLMDGTRNFPWLNLAQNFHPDLSVYHSTDSVLSTVKGMQQKCAGVMTCVDDKGASCADSGGVQILTFGSGGAQPGKEKNKVFVNFGTHGREYVTSEVALKFIEKLCDGSDRTKSVLASTEFKMIPLLNIAGRKKVELKKGCESQRKNSNDVDLNRNFAFEWDKGSNQQKAEDYHGPSAMSEYESKLLNTVVGEFKPKVFVDMHSGDTTMMYPWSHATKQFDNTGQYSYSGDMVDMLKYVNEKAFQSRVRTGVASLTLSPPYTAAGTALDYFYHEKQIPYAFTFEVFAGPRGQAAGAISLLAGASDEGASFNAVTYMSQRDNGTIAAVPSQAATATPSLVQAQRDNGTISAIKHVNLVAANAPSMASMAGTLRGFASGLDRIG